MSVGKSSAIGEMLTVKNAPSPPHVKEFLLTSCFFQFAGIFHEIPCSSHFTSWPFAINAAWAAVGFGFSTGSSPILLGLPEDDEGEDDPELLLPLSLLLKLHAIKASTNTNIHGRCFIASPIFLSLGIKNGNGLLLERLISVKRNQR